MLDDNSFVKAGWIDQLKAHVFKWFQFDCLRLQLLKMSTYYKVNGTVFHALNFHNLMRAIKKG